MTTGLELTINGNKITGWTEAAVIAGIERVPRQFELATIFSVDETLAKSSPHLAPAGQPCTLSYNGTPIITGYVDAVHSTLADGQHEIVYVGRGACEDIVDCSFDWFGADRKAYLNATSIGDAVRAICQPDGINVITTHQNLKQPIPAPLTQNLGMTKYSAIEELNTWAGALMYEDGLGQLVMTAPASEKASGSMITHDVCIASTVAVDLSATYSDYYIYETALPDVASLTQSSGQTGPTTGYERNHVWDDRVRIGGKVPRQRKYIELVTSSLNTAIYGSKLVYSKVYATWLANRRMGYAQPVEVVLPGWLDGGGVLWTPNSVVNVLLPHQNIGFLTAPLKMLIVECRYSISLQGGTTTTLRLMPPEAFDVKPVTVPLNRDIQQLTQGDHATKNP